MNLLKFFSFALLVASLFIQKTNAEPLVDTNASIKSILNDIAIDSKQVLEGRKYWLDLSTQSHFDLNNLGVNIGVGRRWRYFGLDLRASVGNTTFGAIKAENDAYQSTGLIWSDSVPGQENDRIRLKDDPWKYFFIEPGISVEAQLFPHWLKSLSERVRTGFVWGTLTDQYNALSFTAYLLSIETTLIYQWQPGSPWSIEGSLFWQFGSMMLNDTARDVAVSNKRLPVERLGSSIGVLYSF